MSKLIRFGEPIEKEVPPYPLPQLNRGPKSSRLYDNPFVVFFVEGVHDSILEHLQQTPNIESGGILVGHPFRSTDGETTYVVVTGAIPQHSERRSVTHFTVGPEENRKARHILEEKYPGEVAVGWYHSHPGHGIFLSGQDMTIVENIYNASWHIALVVDPISNKEGIFYGPRGIQIGPKGNQDFGYSWIRFGRIPTSIKAIKNLNLVEDAIEQSGTDEAEARLNGLKSLVESRPELDDWWDNSIRELERNIKTIQSRKKLDKKSVGNPSDVDISQNVHQYSNDQANNYLSQTYVDGNISNDVLRMPVHSEIWAFLGLSVLGVACVAYFLFLFNPSNIEPTVLTALFAIVFSIFTVGAIYVVHLMRKSEQQLNNQSMYYDPEHRSLEYVAVKRLAQVFMILLLLVWLVWGGLQLSTFSSTTVIEPEPQTETQPTIEQPSIDVREPNIVIESETPDASDVKTSITDTQTIDTATDGSPRIVPTATATATATANSP